MLSSQLASSNHIENIIVLIIALFKRYLLLILSKNKG